MRIRDENGKFRSVHADFSCFKEIFCHYLDYFPATSHLISYVSKLFILCGLSRPKDRLLHLKL